MTVGLAENMHSGEMDKPGDMRFLNALLSHFMEGLLIFPCSPIIHLDSRFYEF